jgi:hypothetical protein
MLLFIPRSLCALKRVAAKAEHARFGATQGIRIAVAAGLYRAEATDGHRAIIAQGLAPAGNRPGLDSRSCRMTLARRSSCPRTWSELARLATTTCRADSAQWASRPWATTCAWGSVPILLPQARSRADSRGLSKSCPRSGRCSHSVSIRKSWPRRSWPWPTCCGEIARFFASPKQAAEPAKSGCFPPILHRRDFPAGELPRNQP